MGNWELRRDIYKGEGGGGRGSKVGSGVGQGQGQGWRSGVGGQGW